MSQLNLQTRDGRSAFEPGETIEVRADWQLDAPCDAIELRLVWHTAGKGDTDLSVVESQRQDAPRQFDSWECTMQLPDAPYSFSGKLITLIWGLELVALPSDESSRLDITLAPGGKEILLHAESTFA